MKIGIIGLSASGKTTLFNSFMGGVETKGALGTVSVPDDRLEELSRLYHPKKTVHAVVAFEDCLPLDAQAKADKVKLQERLRTMDAFVLVSGAYRASTTEEAAAEVRKARFELIISDLDLVLKRMEKLEREIRVEVKDRALKEKEMLLLQRLQPLLEEEKMVKGLTFDPQDEKTMSNYNLLTRKPVLYLLNVSESQMKEAEEKLVPAVLEALKKVEDDSPVIALNAALEAEIAAMPSEESEAFLKEYGISELGRGRVIRGAFQLLDLLTFYTVGEDECRAWNIPHGATALEAAGAIHSDLARGFIRAEVVDSDSLLQLGSLAEAKKAAKLRLEGKTYIVKDREIVHIMFNV